MRLVSFERDGKAALGIREGEEVRVIGSETLESLLARGVDLAGYAREHASRERVPARWTGASVTAAIPSE